MHSPHPLGQARIPPIPYTQPLQKRNNSQSSRSRPVVAPVVGSTCDSHHAGQNTGDALVVDVVDACLRPLVVEDAYDASISILLPQKVW